MSLLRIPAPDLAPLSVGGASLRLLEGLGFSADGRSLLVRATFFDDADPVPGRPHYGVWLYDLTAQTYRSCLNTELAGGDAGVARMLDVQAAQLVGTGSGQSILAESLVRGSDQVPTLSRVTVSGIADVLSPVLGADAEVRVRRWSASADGRFVALQTDSTLLAPVDAPDTNEVDDIYLVDLVARRVDRVSYLGGSEVAAGVSLGNVIVVAGRVQVAFTTEAAFSAKDANETADPAARVDAYLWSAGFDAAGIDAAPVFTLVSTNRSGAAAGFVSGDYLSPIATARGVYFNSSSNDLVAGDTNEAIDAFVRAADGSLRTVLPSALGLPSTGAAMVSASADGRYVALLSDAPAFSQDTGVQQLVVVDTSVGSVRVASQVGTVPADDIVIDAQSSTRGSATAFTSAAPNLASGGVPEALDGGLYVDPGPSPYGVTLSGLVYGWKTHALLSGVDIRLQASPSSHDVPTESVLTDQSGAYGFEDLAASLFAMEAARSLTSAETGGAIGAADALAALKIAVGRNPNPDPDGTGPLSTPPVSPYQFIAADVNQDGKVTSADALAILKMAVKRADAPARTWVFVPETADFWDEHAANGLGAFTTTRSTVSWDRSGSVDLSGGDATRNLVAVLLGDVNGSWTPSAGTAVLPDSHFEALRVAGIGPLSQWGLQIV